MQTHGMQLSADQIVEETRDWPEDAVADLIDRIWRANGGEVDPLVDRLGRMRRGAELPTWRAARCREYGSRRRWQKRAKSPASESRPTSTGGRRISPGSTAIHRRQPTVGPAVGRPPAFNLAFG
jgi:hypothetical protein